MARINGRRESWVYWDCFSVKLFDGFRAVPSNAWLEKALVNVVCDVQSLSEQVEFSLAELSSVILSRLGGDIVHSCMLPKQESVSFQLISKAFLWLKLPLHSPAKKFSFLSAACCWNCCLLGDETVFLGLMPWVIFIVCVLEWLAPIFVVSMFLVD